MSRKASVSIAALICGAVAGILAWWAKETYDHVERTQSFYYAMIGYPMWRIDAAAAKDAADAVAVQSTAAWVLLAAALALMVAAIIVKNDVAPPPAPSAG
jgi:hypothetical protein